MNELDPRYIGTPEQAKMVTQRILCAVFRLCMDDDLAKAQAGIDKFKERTNDPRTSPGNQRGV